jgi:hypothetical protein
LYRERSLTTAKIDIITKATPQDYSQFQTEVTDKYPGYVPPNFPSQISSPILTINASASLAKAMGYTNATENIELLYQTLFPPKSSSTNGASGILNKKHTNNASQQLQNYFSLSPHVSPAFVLPLTQNTSNVPESIKESGEVYISNMHLSLANYQIIQERSKGIQKWHLQQKVSVSDDRQKNEDEKVDLIEKLYVK